MSSIPTVYNGRSAEEWYFLYAKEAVRVSELLAACEGMLSNVVDEVNDGTIPLMDSGEYMTCQICALDIQAALMATKKAKGEA
jgi:hypothetical protein